MSGIPDALDPVDPDGIDCPFADAAAWGILRHVEHPPFPDGGDLRRRTDGLRWRRRGRTRTTAGGSEERQSHRMGQIQLFSHPRHPGPVVAAYGGGVNTIAALVLLEKQIREGLLASRGQWLQAIVMADPGDEHKETYQYRDEVANPWLVSKGLPTVTVVTRKEEAQFRPRAYKTLQMTLREECLRIKALPSIAYGWKKCSQKYKGDPQRWWCERQDWAKEHWAKGGKITKVIGYDADEPERALDDFSDPAEARRYGLYYVILEGGYDREGCKQLILEAGLPLPRKSACRFCPSNQIEEWLELRENDPEGWAQALEMEANAEIDVPEVVGLLRIGPHGKRQLRFLDELAEKKLCGSNGEKRPCDCAI